MFPFFVVEMGFYTQKFMAKIIRKKLWWVLWYCLAFEKNKQLNTKDDMMSDG